MDILHMTEELFHGRKDVLVSRKAADQPSFQTSQLLGPTSQLQVHTSTHAASKYTREQKLNN